MIPLDHHFKTISDQMDRLPDKPNFKIGEVGNIVGVSHSILRYWEKKLPTLKPQKFANKQRIYFKKDIKTLFLIKALFYKENLSIRALQKSLPYCYRKLQQRENYLKTKNSAKKKVYQLLDSIEQMRRLTKEDIPHQSKLL